MVEINNSKILPKQSKINLDCYNLFLAVEDELYIVCSETNSL